MDSALVGCLGAILEVMRSELTAVLGRAEKGESRVGPEGGDPDSESSLLASGLMRDGCSLMP